MARYFLLTLVFALISTITVAQQTSLAGKITDGESGEELIGANVTLYKGGVLNTGTSTDFEGNYSLNVDPGTYDVEVSYIGYQATRITAVVIRGGQANKLDVKLGEGMGGGVDLDEIVVTEYKVPLIRQDETTQGGIVTAEQIANLPSKNIGALAATTAGLSQVDEGDAISVRGSRPNGTDVYVDGIRVNSSAVQSTDIEQMQVITGGIPANYGDVTGGVISITTKGPSGKFTGGIEVETSEFLDAYGYNDFRAYISGPILKKKSGESILGFRFSGSYISRKDDDPPAVDVFVVNDEALTALEENPIERIGDARVSAAERLTNDNVDTYNYRPNEESSILNITGKIDARLSKNVDVTLTGAYVDQQNKFTPGGWRLMNSHNNPTSFNDRYRANFRFRHRLGGGGMAAEGEDETKKSSFIQNAQYILQFGYEHSNGSVYDPRHEDRLFDYGHVGAFDYDFEPAYETELDFSTVPTTVNITHVDYSQNLVGYDATVAKNQVLANYNNFSDDIDETTFEVLNGTYISNTSIYQGLHSTPGAVYNLFNKNESDLYTGNATVSFDLLPGSSDKGRHSVQIGMTYEQRFTRNYSVSPFGLWQVARQAVNDRHIIGLDTNVVVGTEEVFGQMVPIYNTLLTTPEDRRFYQTVRNLTGASLNEFVNVGDISPDQLSLEMFSPSELISTNGLIDFYGYDYLGNKLGNDITFDDFFTSKYDDGVRSFLSPSNQPNYLAFYLQDKFTFKDVILRLGVRVDRYDANTKVMKDPYSLYEIQSASEFATANGQTVPGAVGEDFKVYVEGDGSSVVKAYRNGDQWFTPEGDEVNSGTLIFGGSPVFPAIKNEDADIKTEGYEISNSFEDYEPQINWMPRIAFSFPISDAANFFAHYDILVQRPQSNTLVTPLDYYFFYERTPENNANLKPERTVDYEVGFQQKLSNSSAIKIAAYYKEMRDMIQLRTYLHVPTISTYTTFGNLDFGTVKGFTFQYDLRRTGNVQASINYTLQFADGTGSDSESQRGLTSRGNIRYLYPLNFDERHRLVASVDYRYASGKKYNGPRWFGKDVFSNTGLNVQAIAVSGRPYTVKQVPTRFAGAGTEGSINGARKPWTFTLNARLDKSFNLTKKAPGKRPVRMNVFFRIQNILNTKNIVNVYSASGSADDDGFLASNDGQESVDAIDPSKQQAFQDAYGWALQNPNLFTLPRRMYLGANINF